MITEQPILPLLFYAEDEDLWKKLQKLSAENLSKITKQALREFFQAHPELMLNLAEDVRAEVKELAEFSTMAEVEKNRICETDEMEDELEVSPKPLEFTLESLFEMSPAEVRPDPVQNLLSIIGEEEDEEVLRLFRRTEEHKEE